MTNSNHNKNTTNLLDYIREIAKDKNLEVTQVATILAESFKKVYLKEFNNNKIEVQVDLQNNAVNMWRFLEVVTDEFFNNEGDEDDETLMPLSQAQKIGERIKRQIVLGEFIKKPISFVEIFDNKSVRNILSIFNQLITETVNKQICEQWINYKGTVIEGRVEKIDESYSYKDIKGVVVHLENDEGNVTKGYLTRHEFVHYTDRYNNKVYEQLHIDQKYLFFIKDVHEFSSGWPVNLSRTNPEIVRYLMKNAITEISDGTIEIKNIARIAGQKTKVLVLSHSVMVDAVGSCVGPRGKRLKMISDQLMNEKIDIIEWDENPIKTVINAVIPGKVLGYQILEDKDEKNIILITNQENYLSTIGKKGNNIRLASILTGWNIDVKTDQIAKEEKLVWENADDLYSSNRSISERIYDKHKISHEEFLRQINEIGDDDVINEDFADQEIE